MEKEVHVARVDAYKTKSGNTRFVLRDDDGDEYTTFKEAIARQAVAAEGRRARIEFHEQERNGFTNVYLDRVEPLEDESAQADGAESADEVAWKTAVDAAPWLLGVAGLAYGIVAITGGGVMVALSWRLYRSPDKRAAKQLFGISILYLFVLFAVLLIERGLHIEHVGLPFGRVFA